MPPNATLCLYRSRNPLTTHYILNNHILEHVQENPYLGVIISKNLKWSTYINKICNKVNSTLGFIRRNLKHCNRKFKETAYISLVRSLFDYSSTVWDLHLQKDIDRIENVQRRQARFIYSDYKRTSSVTAIINELGWKPLNERRKEQRLVLLFKIVNDLVAIPADNNIEYNQRPSRTSNSKQIKVPSATTEIYKHSFVPITVKDWNTLTESAVSRKTVEGFKAVISRD